jgi:phosphopantetheine adenylyltransferase
MDTGVKTGGDDFIWNGKRMNERTENPTLKSLMKEANSLFIEHNNNEKSNKLREDIDDYLKSFNLFLTTHKYKTFTENSKELTDNKKNNKSGKASKLSKKDLIIQNNKSDIRKKEINEFINSLNITNHMPFSNKNYLTLFFNIILWALYLISNKKKDIDNSIYLNCTISLYRSIIDSSDFLFETFSNELYEILNKLQTILDSKISDKYKFFYTNQLLFLQSFWDKNKPNTVSLYEEQKVILNHLVNSNTKTDNKLVFYISPPANGKTELAVIGAKLMALKKTGKILLYICPNSIVRDEVALRCISIGIDVKFWIANNQMDKQTGQFISRIYPHKSCYDDWNSKLRSKDDLEKYLPNRVKRYDPDISVQIGFYLEETRPIVEQIFYKDIRNSSNRQFGIDKKTPNIIIADQKSGVDLLMKYPEYLEVYFDEPTASSDDISTAQIFNKMSSGVLVSATLPKPDELPSVITHFKNRNNFEKNDFLHIVESTRQNISATFIDQNGNIFAPHNIIKSFDNISDFIIKLNDPLVRRGYSPEVVFNMISKIDIYLSDNLKFNNFFKYYGQITHNSLREYACNIIKWIHAENKIELFNILQRDICNKISNMDINTVFTTSAINYQYCNSLLVSSLNNFNNKIEEMCDLFLKGSPKISHIVSEYERHFQMLTDQLKSFLKGKMDDDTEELVKDLNKSLNNLKINFPQEYVFNSRAHAIKNNTVQLLKNENMVNFISKDDINILDEMRIKLLFSNIGIYQPEIFDNAEMDLFLKNKDKLKLILSTPAIVFGTNIGLSIIDIDESFKKGLTKNTLYQLIGRAGRRGKSESAMIIFRDNNMLDIIFNDEYINVEAENIERNYQTLL